MLLSAHSGLNFWIGNNPVANGYPQIPPGLRASQQGMLTDSIRIAEETAGHRLSRAEVSRFWSDKANAFIHEHPRQWLGLMARKLRNFWSATQYDDLSIINPMREEGVLLCMAALLPVFVTERYRLLAVPGLLLLGACGIAELWGALASHGWKRAGLGLGAGAAAYCLIQVALNEPELEWRDLYNSGQNALETGNLSSARAKLERALALSPQNAEVLSALGCYWLVEHDFAKAREYCVRALESNPQTLSALNNLALVEMEGGHWAEAQALLLAALRIEPNDPKIHELATRCARQLER